MTEIKTPKARKAPVTHQNLTITYMLQGAAALDPFLVDHTDPVGVLDRVIDTLEKNGKDPEDLRAKRAFLAEKLTPGVKGRKPAKIGDARKYRAQMVKDNDVFLRLPLGTLGVRKGDDLIVSFLNGSIVVKPA